MGNVLAGGFNEGAIGNQAGGTHERKLEECDLKRIELSTIDRLDRHPHHLRRGRSLWRMEVVRPADPCGDSGLVRRAPDDAQWPELTAGVRIESEHKENDDNGYDYHPQTR